MWCIQPHQPGGIIEASATKDWLAPSVILPIIAGVVIITIFLWLESRSDHPSFDVSLFSNRGYAVSLTAVSMAFFAMSGITFSLPFYLQILRGYTTLAAGLCFLPFAVGQLIAAPRSAAMVKRFGYRFVMTGGLILVAIAMFLLARVPIDAHHRFLRVRIENGDDLPLKALRVDAEAMPRPLLVAAGFRIDHSTAGLYLWATRDEDCWKSVDWFAQRGVIVTPGSFYGQAGQQHVRVALTAHDDAFAQLAARVGAGTAA